MGAFRADPVSGWTLFRAVIRVRMVLFRSAVNTMRVSSLEIICCFVAVGEVFAGILKANLVPGKKYVLSCGLVNRESCCLWRWCG
jgi:hypothetical protein